VGQTGAAGFYGDQVVPRFTDLVMRRRELTPIRARVAASLDGAVVEVEDDGPGMPADFVRRRLFRPFQTTKAGGVGLGLYTARRILRHHRGDVEVRSAQGEGTRVRLLLPLSSLQGRQP